MSHSLGVMKNWMPKLHQYYINMLEALHKKDLSLQQTFKGSMFAATTYNLGPRTACFKHKDHANLAFGMCSITALGDFDPKKSGHLILWECGLVIEFPPGASILIPSATITHSNVEVSTNERRYSFTQYTAGALFRWVENNFQTAKQFLEPLSEEQLAEVDKKNAERWSLGLSLIPKFNMYI
jgi:hypothetical protein